MVGLSSVGIEVALLSPLDFFVCLLVCWLFPFVYIFVILTVEVAGPQMFASQGLVTRLAFNMRVLCSIFAHPTHALSESAHQFSQLAYDTCFTVHTEHHMPQYSKVATYVVVARARDAPNALVNPTPFLNLDCIRHELFLSDFLKFW